MHVTVDDVNFCDDLECVYVKYKSSAFYTIILFPGAIAGLADQPIQNIVAQQTQTDKVPTTTAAGSIMTGVGKGLVGAFTK